ncbi:MAG: Rrf2 family transcriptional regulator [Acidobacteriaceae bacterium]
MAVNSRFSTSVHALLLLAADSSKLHRSEDLAERLKTNPVVVRRVFSQLRQAGLVISHKGPSGGSKLARGAADITLRDIYQAVHLQGTVNVPSLPAGLQSALKSVLSTATRAFEDELSHTTLAQFAKRAARKPKR